MYYLLLILLYPLSLLPLGFLYVLSDMLYVLVYRIGGYRKNVTLDNLRHAFPEKRDDEIRVIMKHFYRTFFDQIAELIKLLSISEKALSKRVTGNWEVFNELDEKERNAYTMLGHTFNWEWVNVATQYHARQQFAGVYMPVKSNAMNKLMTKIRTRGGGWLISMKAKRGFQRLNGVRYIAGLIADQNPSNMNGALWLPFMHRDAPFYTGPEVLARRAKAAIVFAGIKWVKRGYYEVMLEVITKDASTVPEHDIIKKYAAFMEQQLREQPSNWMWTHKRWKHKKDNAA